MLVVAERESFAGAKSGKGDKNAETSPKKTKLPREADRPSPRFVSSSSVLTLILVASLLLFSALLHALDPVAEPDVDAVDRYVRGRRVKTYRPKLVCYFNHPRYDDSRELYPEGVDPHLCTHLNVAFASIKNSSVALTPALERTLRNATALKRSNPRLKILLSVGGAGSDADFSEMIQTHATRKIFIRSVRDALNEYGLDGVDLDWEFPVVGSGSGSVSGPTAKDERLLFSILLVEIRREFDRSRRSRILSVAVAAQRAIADAAYNIAKMNEAVDFVNLMTYDFHFYTKLTPFTGLNSPLYPKRDDRLYLATLNVNSSARFWLERGMSADKIVIGLPTFGHSFELMNENNNREGSPAKGYGRTGDSGFVDFPEVCDFMKRNRDAKYVFDNETASPYVTFATEWISFDDEDSLERKTAFVRDGNFGGVMIYALNSDDYTGRCGSNVEDAKNFTLSEQIRKTLFEDY